MNLLKRLWHEEDGQGLVEYTFVVLLVALVFWMGVRDTNISKPGESLQLRDVAFCLLRLVVTFSHDEIQTTGRRSRRSVSFPPFQITAAGSRLDRR